MDHVPHHTIIGADHTGATISISPTVRFFHAALLGGTGSGKSTLLEHMIAQDMARGDGVLVIDPHGPLAARVAALVPRHRTNHVCLFDPSDTEHPLGWNIFDEPDHALHPRIADAFTMSMKVLWPDSWGPRLENLMRAAAATLLATPDASPALMQRLLTDDAWRERVIGYVRNTTTLNFWNNEYRTWTDQERREARGPVMNKIDQLLFHPQLLHILGQRSSTLNINAIMRDRRIMIANLALGSNSESATFLIGSMLLARFCAAGYDRGPLIEKSPAEVPPFHIYVDEARSFVAKPLRDLLRDMRKFKVSLTLSTQGTSDLDPLLKSTILDNAGTIILMRLGADDAVQLAPQLNREHQEFNAMSLTTLATGEAHVKMQTPHGSVVHHIRTPAPLAATGNDDALRKQSRQKYSRDVEHVAAYIREVTSHTTVKPKRLARPKARMPAIVDVADYIKQVNDFTADLEPPAPTPRKKTPPKRTAP